MEWKWQSSRTTRRAFMASAGVSLMATAIATLRSQPKSAASQLQGMIHALGTPAISTGGRAVRNGGGLSILVSIDIATQQVRHTQVPLSSGHSVLCVGGGRLLCVSHHGNDSLVLDGSYKLIKRLTAPAGYVFGGHALVRPDGLPVVYIPMRNERPKSLADHGLIAAYDAERIELIHLAASGGIHPHELAAIPKTGELAVTHYGDLYVSAPPLRHNAVEARLAVLDLANLRVLRHYDVPEYRAMLTHMRVMNDLCAYCVLTQYIAFDDTLQDYAEQIALARREMDRIYARHFDFAFPPQSRAERMVAVPLPFLRINTQTGQRQQVLLADDLHLRSQSVAVNSVMQMAVAAYPHSNTLVVCGTDGNVRLIRGEEIGLPEVRGVSDIPGSPMIAVSSTYRGLSIVDLRTRQLVSHISSRQFDAPHIDYAPSDG